ncbi:MAG TPA: methyltransferase domain-containing protein [Thermomicrobiales bacterium]|nr:methyltransferase domain-containing protein [Thermomicrobiales bacterium]
MTMTPEQIRRETQRHWEGCYQNYAQRAAPQTAKAAEMLLAIVPPPVGGKVLDVATGPGVVALRAARAVGPNGEVVATDLMGKWQPFIERACAVAGLDNCSFRQMGAEALDFADDSFDVVYCQFGLMFVPEPVRGLQEMRRVVRSGGRIGVVVWSTAEEVPCFQPARIIGRFTPLMPDDKRLPTPLALGEPGLIEGMVAEAGFDQIKVERRSVETVISDPEEYWQELIRGVDERTGAALTTINDAEYDQLHRQVIDFLEGFRDGDEIRLPNQAIFVSATK